MITPLKPGDSVAKNWRTINRLIDLAEQSTARIYQLEHPGRRRFQVSPADDPFEIKRGSTWLKFKVATGFVTTTGEEFVPSGVDYEFTVASGTARHWFYLFINPTDAVIMDSATPPPWDVKNVPIGYADTLTDVATSQSNIVQLLTDHVFNPCVT